MISAARRLQLWIYSHFWAGMVLLLRSFLLRQRMSHDNGTTAIGRIKVVDAPTFPAHEFFAPARVFTARLRHASVSYPDDTVIQVRSASLKFADSFYDSPFDLEMNTGTISLFWSARNFLEFAAAGRMVNGLAFSTFYDKYPRGLLAAKEGLRRNPTSFSQMYYHSQCAQLFLGIDGVRRYAKFRLIPNDRGPESGLIPIDELTDRWSELVAPGETGSPNYLKQEFAERIGRAPVLYHLQIQLHTVVPGEDAAICNCNIAWDETTHPWMDVASVELSTLLSLDANNKMRFSLRHAPPTLAALPAVSIDDYNSINYMRIKSDYAKSARLFFYRIFGMPKRVSESRPV